MRSIISLASGHQLCSLVRGVNSTRTDIAEHEEKAVCPSPPNAVCHTPTMPSIALAEPAAERKSRARHLILKSMPEGKHIYSTSLAKSPGHIHRSRIGSSACLGFRTDRCGFGSTSQTHKTFSSACHESYVNGVTAVSRFDGGY
jgi:hypothetical protein